MKFSDYIWALAHIIFRKKPKEDRGTKKFFKNVIGGEVEEAETNIYGMREQMLIWTATGSYLDELGKSRKIYREAEESDDDYRVRILDAWNLYAMGGTTPGMENALAKIGYEEVTVYPFYLDGPNSPRWAEFMIEIDPETYPDMTEEEHQQVMDVIDRQRPAKAKGFLLYKGFYTDDSCSLTDFDLLMH
jgi:hypothetical protein